MVTFVPQFVSPACRGWDLEAAAEAERRGLDYKTMASREQLSDWVAEHPMPTATVTDVADHVEHVRNVAGIDHVGIGGDYDGVGSLPAGLEDVSGYPVLFAELLDRGWSADELGKLANRNILRVLRAAEDIAADAVTRTATSA